MDTNTNRIFILDDEEIFSFSMEHYLKKGGFSDIHRFQNSETLLKKMHEQPDVLILDHFLHNEIGLDILGQIKQTHPKIKVIYLSAQKTAAIAVRALKLGAFAYLEKSVTDIQEVIELIKSEENPEFQLN
jgi:DNA-binding NtrC family response regulator